MQQCEHADEGLMRVDFGLGARPAVEQPAPLRESVRWASVMATAHTGTRVTFTNNLGRGVAVGLTDQLYA
jgi:hypothetical protein